jgi:hypothetical protein
LDRARPKTTPSCDTLGDGVEGQVDQSKEGYIQIAYKTYNLILIILIAIKTNLTQQHVLALVQQLVSQSLISFNWYLSH